MSLSFLFCKPWHPATTWNQKKIWEAEQADLKQKKDEASARKELKRDSDRRFYEELAGGKRQDASSAALNFMYNPPPGYQQPEEEELNDDDESVKKFKALAKMKADPNFSAAASCSELEKLVGRKKNPGVSLAEQQERFPFLKDAPVEHAYAAGVKVNFKPFNNVVRHVRCMRCGEWGHRSGDRECKVDENPNDAERQRREDPMSHMTESHSGTAAGSSKDGGGDANGDGDPDSEFLNSLSTKKKRRLLRLLQKMEAKKHRGVEEEKGRARKKSRKGSSRKRGSDGSSDSKSRRETGDSRRKDGDSTSGDVGTGGGHKRGKRERAKGGQSESDEDRNLSNGEVPDEESSDVSRERFSKKRKKGKETREPTSSRKHEGGDGGRRDRRSKTTKHHTKEEDATLGGASDGRRGDKKRKREKKKADREGESKRRERRSQEETASVASVDDESDQEGRRGMRGEPRQHRPTSLPPSRKGGGAGGRRESTWKSKGEDRKSSRADDGNRGRSSSHRRSESR